MTLTDKLKQVQEALVKASRIMPKESTKHRGFFTYTSDHPAYVLVGKSLSLLPEIIKEVEAMQIRVGSIGRLPVIATPKPPHEEK
jgi:hypothetical protein